jgi:rSAM/selenodomain-associated transferase 2
VGATSPIPDYRTSNPSFSKESRKIPLKVSVVIPTLNEASVLERTLNHVRGLSPHEVVVADGGSEDDTLEIGRRLASHTVSSARGRALQMNAGAQKCTGDLLLFLHADSKLEVSGYQKMLSAMENKSLQGGAFGLQIDSDQPALKLISTLATLRSKHLNLVYGDQAIFVRQEVFHQLAGYAPLPICEDLDFYRRMLHQGPVVLLKEKALISPRRWHAEGVGFTTLRNIAIAALFLLGFSPKTLSKWYGIVR